MEREKIRWKKGNGGFENWTFTNRWIKKREEKEKGDVQIEHLLLDGEMKEREVKHTKKL